MWTEYNGILGVGCLSMLVLAILWFILERRLGRHGWKYRGAVSTAVAALIVAGTWFVDDVPWIWLIPQVTILLWLATLILMMTSVVSAWCIKKNDRWPLVTVGLLSLGCNACSFLVFLWMATVSPAGV